MKAKSELEELLNQECAARKKNCQKAHSVHHSLLSSHCSEFVDRLPQLLPSTLEVLLLEISDSA